MTFKPTTLVVLAIATIMAAASTGTEAWQPDWCVCSNNMPKTQIACTAANGNWDGGSCGIVTNQKYDDFVTSCNKQRGQTRCWL
ncbi:hypothetical protein BGX24_004899 [Mortierella sp. AD032]|nr:hypothetical protein BGX24_004899 [Mortierella sp. AD032]